MAIRYRVSLLEQCGIVAVLFLTNDEADHLDAEDEQLLRDFGAQPQMLDQLRSIVRVPGRRIQLDFARQRVTIEEGYPGEGDTMGVVG